MRAKAAFRRLWLATTVSQVGTQVSELAIPFIAIVTLHATPFQIGLLMAIEFAPIIVFSLPIGVRVDRLRRRPLLITSDLARAALLCSIPAAYAAGLLALPQLYVVGFCVGSFSVLFDTASQAYLPSVVDRQHLVTANGKLQISEQGASVVGPALGGSLISLLSAPLAVAVDVVSYVCSAALLGSITAPEAAPVRVEAGPAGHGVFHEMIEGVRYVLWHPILRPLVLTSATIQFFGRIVMAVLLVYLVREVGLNGAAVGTVLSIGSIGFVLGAVIAPKVSSGFGLGRTLSAGAAVASVASLFYAVAPRNLAGVFVAAGFFVYGLAALTWTVNALSLRQAITPSDKLGRTSATMRLFSWGSIPLGSVIGGLLGNTIGLRQTILIGALGGLLGALPVLLSPVRRLSRLGDLAANRESA